MAFDPQVLRRAKAVMFDAYGTLFDVHSAVARHAAAAGPAGARLSEIWRAKQLEYTWVLSLAGRYAPFWSLTQKALDHAFARCPEVDPALRRDLLAAYRALDPYPDVHRVLAAMQARRLRTGILSNGDPEMLQETVLAAGLADALDPVLSVDAVGVFKTSPRAYALAPAALGLDAGEIAFVSSNRWDIAGAAAFGFVPIWVNRAGMPDEYADLAPAAVVASLAEIVAGG